MICLRIYLLSLLFLCQALWPDFGVRRLDCALAYDGLSRHSFPATVEVVFFLIFLLRSAKFKSGVKPPHSKDSLPTSPKATKDRPLISKPSEFLSIIFSILNVTNHLVAAE